jgi:hypothetical protein
MRQSGGLRRVRTFHRRHRIQIESSLKHLAPPLIVIGLAPPRAAPSTCQTSLADCRLVRRSWPIKLEGRFKRRDERDVNARSTRAGRNSGSARKMGICRVAHQRFTVRLSQIDNHPRNGMRSARRSRTACDNNKNLGEGKCRQQAAPAERGRRRTRQDQISPARVAACEIANL